MPLVGSNGLEPSTSRLSGVRSNHLSYEPISVAGSFPIGQTFCCVDLAPSASARSVFPLVQTTTRLGSAPRRRWWRRTESNCRPPACKAGALPAELRPHIHRFVARVSPPSEFPLSRTLKIKQCIPYLITHKYLFRSTWMVELSLWDARFSIERR